MFLESRALTNGDALQADVCIVGSGAAGITIAREFIGTSTNVVLLEGGGLSPDPDGDGIHVVLPGSSPHLSVDPAKKQYFGGNTNRWSANCRPLDEADFEPHDWIRYSGWPIRRQQLLPYYERAQVVCGLGELRWYDVDACRPHLVSLPLDVNPSTLSNRIVQTCPVPSFRALYSGSFETTDNVRVVLHARALRFRTSSTTGAVQALEIAGSAGRQLRVEANVFVLAAGGVENAALLLRSNDVCRNGLGNDADLVGRFFMEHWHVNIPLVNKLPHDVWFYTRRQPVGGSTVWGQLIVSEARMRHEHAPGLALWFPPVVSDQPDASVDLSQQQLLRVQIEQVPDPANRIRLSSEVDPNGQPRPSLTLRLGRDERRHHVRSLQLATSALGMDGPAFASQMTRSLDAGQFGFFWHHMGTTRMHDDPAQGVVDRNCRVHGVSNLFVAGSSVFPTGGTAGPTLTIVALALRLADYLRESVV